MNSDKYFKWFTQVFVLLFSCIGLSISHAGIQSSPTGLLTYIADNMVTQLRNNKATLKTKPEIVYNIAYKYVVPYADLPEMSKRVLPPKVWNSATTAERAKFESEFTRLVIRTYASALTSYQDQEVKIYPVRGEMGNTVEVRSVITSSNSSPINVTYRLLKSGGNWKLYDMSVEGISLISSFRSQFADILANGNMQKLLNKLSQHNAG
jgi:phospholipid transport system substrate-binding protein